MWPRLRDAMLKVFPDEPRSNARGHREGKPMIYRHFVREGNAIEQRRQELLSEVARHQTIRSARGAGSADRRPFAAPGSFLVFIKRHVASGRFRPARPAATTPTPGITTQ